MSILQNTVSSFYVIILHISFCSFSFAAPLPLMDQSPKNQDSVQDATPEQLFSSLPAHSGVEALKENNTGLMMMLIFIPPNLDTRENDEETSKARVKRQSGGKFSDASKMSSTKIMQLYLQMFRNLVSGAPIGGVHPMSPESVKPVVKLFKQRIIAFFFPDVGDSKV